MRDAETGRLVRRVINRPKIVDRETYDEFESDAEFDSEVVGTDTRAPVYDTTRVPYRFVCALEIQYARSNGPLSFKGYGSGTLIGPRHVLTCAHNIRKIDPDTRKVLEAQSINVTPGKSTRMPPFQWTPFGSSIALRGSFYTHSSWLTITKTKPQKGPPIETAVENEDYDFGLIILKQDITSKAYKSIGNKPLGYWGSTTDGGNTRIKAIDPVFLGKKAVFAAGYPGDRCGDEPIKDNCLPGRKNGTQYVSIGAVVNPSPSSNPRQFWHDVDTKTGQSGGPVWRIEPGDSQLYLFGVHTRSFFFSNTKSYLNQAVRLSEDVLNTLRGWGWRG